MRKTWIFCFILHSHPPKSEQIENFYANYFTWNNQNRQTKHCSHTFGQIPFLIGRRREFCFNQIFRLYLAKVNKNRGKIIKFGWMLDGFARFFCCSTSFINSINFVLIEWLLVCFSPYFNLVFVSIGTLQITLQVRGLIKLN